ncbi:MAG: hypothetical protein SGI73_04465 [Chloroflexota bacterium]|nr:hypothetical protein [Chloroflexota bacterium]
MTANLRGKLGYAIDGVYRVVADDAHYYVRFSADGGGGLSVAAIRHGGRIPPIPDLDVQIERDADGNLILLGAASVGANDAGGASVGAHSHDRFSAMPYLSDDRLRLKLRAERGTGLRLLIQPGIVHHVNRPLAWAGGEIDLASPDMRPTTPAEQAWCVVGLDPTARTLVAVTGARQPRALPLTPAQIADVPFAWDAHIALCAVRLRADATTLDETDIEALLHSAFGGTSLMALDRALTDGDALLLDTNGDSIWG